MCMAVCGCARGSTAVGTGGNLPQSAQGSKPPQPSNFVAGGYRGFDRNEYPGDATMAGLRNTFAFTGYWLTNPPRQNANSWHGKRTVLRQQGWGFIVLANGRLDAEILKARKHGIPPADFARQDAKTALAAARSEGFPAHTVLFLDQEEGGTLLPEQAAYLLAWTEAVAAGGYLPGAYASGQPVPDGPRKTTTTIADIRSHVHADHLHPIAIFDAQDTCPPSPGCTVHAKPLAAAGELDLTVWQYTQSPRRPKLTGSCANTYAADGNCYVPGFLKTFLDMDLANSADPSHGR
jgi:hypothetical protein